MTSTPGLSDGTYYVTVYGATNHAFTLINGHPVITDIDYPTNNTVITIINDDPNRVGWRYYRLLDIQQQLDSLGWELILSNHVVGTEIALRSSAVPGRCNYRTSEYNAPQTAGHVHFASTTGLLQRPGHQADIWYVGVYMPTQALGSFTLRARQLVPAPVDFDGAAPTSPASRRARGAT